MNHPLLPNIFFSPGLSLWISVVGPRSPCFPLRSCLVASVFLSVIFFDIDWLGLGRIDARLVAVSAMAHFVICAKANAARHQPDHVKDHVEDHVEDPPHACC